MTVTPRGIIMSLRDDFFHDIESCSTKPANLNGVVFLFYISLMAKSSILREHLGIGKDIDIVKRVTSFDIVGMV